MFAGQSCDSTTDTNQPTVWMLHESSHAACIAPNLEAFDDTCTPTSPSPPHLSIYLPSVSPHVPFFFILVEDATWAVLLSMWSLIAASHHFWQSLFIILSNSLLLHPSLLLICLFTKRKMWYEEKMELMPVWCRLQHPTLSVTHNLSFHTFHPLSVSLSLHVDLRRGGCDMRISFCWCYLVMLITTSHHFCPAEFIRWWCGSPLLAHLLPSSLTFSSSCFPIYIFITALRLRFYDATIQMSTFTSDCRWRHLVRKTSGFQYVDKQPLLSVLC